MTVSRVDPRLPCPPCLVRAASMSVVTAVRRPVARCASQELRTGLLGRGLEMVVEDPEAGLEVCDVLGERVGLAM